MKKLLIKFGIVSLLTLLLATCSDFMDTNPEHGYEDVNLGQEYGSDSATQLIISQPKDYY